MNANLRTIVGKARAANMPADNIDRAIKKGTGELEGQSFEDVMYEGYASGGVALIVIALTDNKNRAAAEIRHIFTKNGSSFAQQGSVSRSFTRRGQILIEREATDEDTLMELVLDAGADDLLVEETYYEVLMDPNAYNDVMAALETAEVSLMESAVTLLPDVAVPVGDLSTAKAVLRFVEDLEDNDDVQNVYHNAEISDEIMQQLAEG